VKQQKYMEYHFPLRWQENWDSNEHALYGGDAEKRMGIHGAKHVAMVEELFKWFCHTEANNIPVDGPTVKGGTSEFALTVDTQFKCFTVWLQLFTEW